MLRQMSNNEIVGHPTILLSDVRPFYYWMSNHFIVGCPTILFSDIPPFYCRMSNHFIVGCPTILFSDISLGISQILDVKLNLSSGSVNCVGYRPRSVLSVKYLSSGVQRIGHLARCEFQAISAISAFVGRPMKYGGIWASADVGWPMNHGRIWASVGHES
jgi:hypothetical protein